MSQTIVLQKKIIVNVALKFFNKLDNISEFNLPIY
jgi:hypothetical protein